MNQHQTEVLPVAWQIRPPRTRQNERDPPNGGGGSASGLADRKVRDIGESAPAISASRSCAPGARGRCA